MKFTDADIIEEPIRSEIYSIERIEEYAAYLAAELKITENPKSTQLLLPRMADNGKRLLSAYRTLVGAVHKKEIISPAAEWLIDNFHVIEDQLREIQQDLPASYYKELPKLAMGELAGCPRIYAIALALVAHCDSGLESQFIRRFLVAFQKVSPLRMGELWAVAITLRLALVENLRRLAIRVVWDREKRIQADEFADQLIANAENTEVFQSLIREIPKRCNDGHHVEWAFIAQLAKRLRNQEFDVWPAYDRLDKFLIEKKLSVEKVVHLEHQLQASNQVTVANIITSMRLLSSLNWQDFFESVSLIDSVLGEDPVKIYNEMDFTTRDQYRHVIERMSKRTKIPELQVARKAVSLAAESHARRPNDSRRAHVGFYLVSRGAAEIRKSFGHRENLKGQFFGFVFSNPNLVYFGLMAVLLALACAVPLRYAARVGSSWISCFWIFPLILIPASDLAMNVLNLILTKLLRPSRLPKLDLSSGVPQDARTMVVIPCMLCDKQTVEDLAKKLEIHYLANKDPQLYFAILGDFTDSVQENEATDAFLLKTARNAIANLNERHALGETRFFHFQRKRQWNSCEKVWMGWERKRGKLQEFNRLLRGRQDTSYLDVALPEDFLNSFRFVLTLDADTQLPRDAARKLVGTMLHPLNQAHLDKDLGRVTEGYGVLQPRVSISLESASRSLFAQIFSGYTGIDPYTTAVSNTYQDLFHEGIFTGKGLYDVDAFEGALSGKVPENTVLSHDLFEGLFARAALITDVELLDDYPTSYGAFYKRQHRWTRGDWQIARWIFSGKAENPIPLIGRWKILDNLRRSLVAPSTLLFLIAGWFLLPGTPLFWTAAGLLVIMFPCVTHLAGNIMVGPHGVPWTSHFWNRWGKAWMNFGQAAFSLTFLAHQAVIQVDAIIRVFYRKFVSRSKLMEWVTAAQVENQIASRTTLWQTPWPTEILLLIVALALTAIQTPRARVAAFPLLILWATYPIFSVILNKKWQKRGRPLTGDDLQLLRLVARRTWNFFETFVTQEDNWLPPDNFQEDPRPLVAHRTSPTNMGLYLLSTIAAKDFGYIDAPVMVDRLGKTFETFSKLERFRGHFFNWYDTTTLQPLTPRYVSTVDSGNLAGYLLAVKQVCLAAGKSAVIDFSIVSGVRDGLLLMENAKGVKHLLSSLSSVSLETPSQYFKFLNSVSDSLEAIRSDGDLSETARSWLDILIRQVSVATTHLLEFIPWLGTERENDGTQLNGNISYLDLMNRYPEIRSHFQKTSNDGKILSEIQKAQETCSKFLNEAGKLAALAEETFAAMDFDFLYNKERQVFFIGYNATNGRHDNSLFDLLASESRLASFISIAKEDVPQAHWFHLGRQLVPAGSGRALISWTASMFEYLMPQLVMRNYEHTLLDETLKTVVKRQIEYGHERQVPWGVSEAGYNARDLQLSYQYGPFGVPGLGLKRGLSQDLVVSPYSTFLAAQVDPLSAIENVRRLVREGLLTQYGFYESVDYTPDRLPEGQNFSIVKSFMAHHQGMNMVALDNVIFHNIMQARFHSEPRVKATHLLLQERIPQRVPVALPKATELELSSNNFTTPAAYVRHYADPGLPSPRVQLLSNGKYSVMISTAGGGYSKCEGLAVTRWKEDPTRDITGQFIFVKDIGTGNVWSTAYQPFHQAPENYGVSVSEEKVEFEREDDGITTKTEVLVAPEDDVEIRRVTLTNDSGKERVLELTSYLEPVLAPREQDLSHPAFSKLFLQTEFVPSKNALLVRRRPRSAEEREVWGLHLVACETDVEPEVQFETDRSLFLGRGRNLSNPVVLSENKNLSQSIGATLDPVLSLRVRVVLPPGEIKRVSFTTGLAKTQHQALELADRYHDVHSFDRESKLAWTKSQVDLRHLGINGEDAYVFQRLAEKIIYSDPSLRLPSHQLALHTRAQSTLWRHGISGDLPLVVVRISSGKDIGVVKRLLEGHEYLRLKGLSYDLVILNEYETSYLQELQDEILRQVRNIGSQGWVGKPGGIHILRVDQIAKEELNSIKSVARVLISADVGSLKEQIDGPPRSEKYPPLLKRPLKRAFKILSDGSALSSVSPRRQQPLEFPNSLGGFSQTGREYVMNLNPGQFPPAPWINVIGNGHDFGFQVSESGAGFTWSVNSRENRLTPWSNDPVSDPSGEVIYLRNEETGEIWTPTPLPIPGKETFTVRHGIGYSVFENGSHGIQQTLTQFVSPSDPIKISHLKLKNVTHQRMKISITSYVEWVLGPDREKSAPHLMGDQDPVSHALIARNLYNDEFSQRVAFSDISLMERSFTCDRKEFLGRNGSYKNPAALKRKSLSGKKGVGLDPCAALQVKLELEPGEEREITMTLGQSENIEEARALTLRYRKPDIIKQTYEALHDAWDSITDALQVKTPEPRLDLLLNSWLLYQTLSCRIWSRTALYQSSGAYGFRDQLQDSMATVYSRPDLARQHILKTAARQFKEGDVQHWWHPPTGRGVRTRISDDLLWLPYVVSFYVSKTGDRSILDEKIAFLEAPILQAGQEDAYICPQISQETGTLLEHCTRTLDHSLALGKNGLPLMGAGDWNDGMNKVGFHGQGESVWMGWFLYKVLEDFMPFCDEPRRNIYTAHMGHLKTSLETAGWDGEWYRRAFFDDGSPLGSSANEDCRIDSLSQTWSVISGAGDRLRQTQAMDNVEKYLIKKDKRLVLLLAPPFDQGKEQPGYIKGYVPGVRENGGQYTHAAVWVAQAYALLGNGDKAVEILNLINPISHASDRESLERYKLEPYVVPADVYSNPAHEGRGGWSWYTGSASWFYRTGLEAILGFQLRADRVRFQPSIPKSWKEFEIKYEYKNTPYHFIVRNPEGLSTGVVVVEMDGVLQSESEIKLRDDGIKHRVIVTLIREKSKPQEASVNPEKEVNV